MQLALAGTLGLETEEHTAQQMRKAGRSSWGSELNGSEQKGSRSGCWVGAQEAKPETQIQAPTVDIKEKVLILSAPKEAGGWGTYLQCLPSGSRSRKVVASSRLALYI